MSFCSIKAVAGTVREVLVMFLDCQVFPSSLTSVGFTTTQLCCTKERQHWFNFQANAPAKSDETRRINTPYNSVGFNLAFSKKSCFKTKYFKTWNIPVIIQKIWSQAQAIFHCISWIKSKYRHNQFLRIIHPVLSSLVGQYW